MDTAEEVAEAIASKEVEAEAEEVGKPTSLKLHTGHTDAVRSPPVDGLAFRRRVPRRSHTAFDMSRHLSKIGPFYLKDLTY